MTKSLKKYFFNVVRSWNEDEKSTPVKRTFRAHAEFTQQISTT